MSNESSPFSSKLDTVGVAADSDLVSAGERATPIVGPEQQLPALTETTRRAWLPRVGSQLPFGALAYAGAGLSLAFCTLKTLVWFLLPAIGMTVVDFEFNPHLQAILMSLFAVIAVLGLSVDAPRCASRVPLAVGTIGLVAIVGTLYVHYLSDVLTIGYVLLLVAAFLNQSIRLRRVTQEVVQLNSALEQKVDAQVQEIEHLTRLKRFLAPAVAELLVSQGNDSALLSHRQHIAALFCDIRGFTSFTENMEPEEVMEVLGTYHEQMGRLAANYEATIDHRAGDGLMLFFNDPFPCENPELKAVQLALDMREAFGRLNERWTQLEYNLGFAVGIASGYATMGVVGFEGRYDYTANGGAVNLAARLCEQATDGQILISRRVFIAVEEYVQATAIENVVLKGVSSPVVVYDIAGPAHAERSS